LQTIAHGAPTPEHLTSRLGPLPDVPAARDTWLGLALHVERRLDAGLDVEPRSGLSVAERLDRLGKSDPIENARAIIATAGREPLLIDPDTPGGPQRWLDTLERATDAHRVLERERSREVDHGIELSL
ncbi:MAG: hypothetical protein ACRD0U_20790, partial [Acidimicrobiales bacterium]